MPEQSFFAELRKRKVVQAAAIYGAVAWGLTEVIVTVVEQLYLPQWVATLAVIFFVVGFPVAMFLSWTFDLTADGVERTAISSRRGTTSIVFSMVLLIAGTAGLFLLIKPEIDVRETATADVDIESQSVAVLPFDYSGPDPADSYLGSGLSDELRDQLGRVDGLLIAARSSSVAALEKGEDAKAMAEQLGVATLLEGSMRRQGNVLRISVQLIDGTNGLALWNNTYQRGPRELLSVQQDIAEAVVRVVMPGSDQAVAGPATQDATANELMILARHYERQVLEREDVDPQLLQRAVELYRDATKADPGSAIAFSRLAVAQMYLGAIDAAGVSASRALDLDPRSAEANSAYGLYLFTTGNERMGYYLERGAELNPNLPDVLARYAYWRWFNVGTDGVANLYERALRLDRLNVTRYAALGRFLALNDRFNDARAVVDQMIARFDGAAAYIAIADVLSQLGDVDHAIAWTIKARNLEPNNPLHVQKLAEYYTDIGAFETAAILEPDLGIGLLYKMRRYDEMIEKAEERYWDYPDDTQLQVYMAQAYVAVGRFDDALRMIEGSGVLDNFAYARRSTEEFVAQVAVLNAAYGSGAVDEAVELASMATTNSHYLGESSYWWVNLNIACIFAIMGDDEEVYRRFRRVRESRNLAWEPTLKDSQCFKRLADDPEYQALVRHFDELRAELRAKLPDTLAQHGVSLY